MPPHIIIERSLPYMHGAAERVGRVTYLDNADFSADRLREADAIVVRSITRCTPELLEDTSVRFIATATAGTDHIDTAYCAEHGISWTNAPGCNATSVAQYVFSSLSLLASTRGLELEGKTIGIVGVGHVGREVDRLAGAFGMRTLLCDPPRAEREGQAGFCSLEDICREADIISLHVPLTRSGKYATQGMVDDEFVHRCTRRPILINACRGAVTQTSSLLMGRQSGLLSALVIDCWEGEPSISLELLARADIATPHIAGFSADGKFRAARMSLQAISGHWGLSIEGLLDSTQALAIPSEPVLSLEGYTTSSACLYRAMLHSFDPRGIDERLRREPETFERLRKDYDHPREMQAYTIAHLPSREIGDRLEQIGFALKTDLEP